MLKNLIAIVMATALLHSTATAQWNAIAGYDVMGAGIDQFNGLLNAINDKQAAPEKLAKPINLLHGFIAGVRYNHPLGAVELLYRRSLTRRRGEMYEFELVNVDEIDFSYRAAAWSLNFEFGKGLIVGGSIDYNILAQRVKYDGAGSDRFRSFKDKQYSWGNRIFIGIHISNTDQISFTLRPFYQWHWSKTNLNDFRNHLMLGEDICEVCLEQPKSFGISLIINNGPQD